MENGVVNLSYPSVEKRGRVQEHGGTLPYAYDIKWNTPLRVFVPIRRLTPLECFRLMGFSDADFWKAKEAGISNSQLYKQAGNSIVVDVLYYIFWNYTKPCHICLRISGFLPFSVGLDF